MNITTIELPIYDIEIVIIINNWEEASKKFKLKFTEEEYEAEAWTIYNAPYLSDSEIFMLFKDDSLDYNTMIHELTHCISGICKLRGIGLDIENDEPIAYLQGYVGQKLFEFRDKYLAKNLEVKQKLLPL